MTPQIPKRPKKLMRPHCSKSQKKSEDTKAKDPAKTTTGKKQPAVEENEDSANKEEATAAAASSFSTRSGTARAAAG